MSLVYSGRSRPVHVCDTFTDEKAKRELANYVKNTYVLNPFYAAYRRGLGGGVYRIRDLAPDAYFESEHRKSLAITLSTTEELGYVTNDWPQGMEEINVVVELPGRELAEISLMRPVRKGGFCDADLRARLGAAGTARITERYTLAAIAPHYLELYRRLLNGESPHGASVFPRGGPAGAPDRKRGSQECRNRFRMRPFA